MTRSSSDARGAIRPPPRSPVFGGLRRVRLRLTGRWRFADGRLKTLDSTPASPLPLLVTVRIPEVTFRRPQCGAVRLTSSELLADLQSVEILVSYRGNSFKHKYIFVQ